MSEAVFLAEFGSWRERALDLDFEIATDYYDFVFDTKAEARAWQQALIETGVAEFDEPWARLMVVDDELAGFFAAVPGRELGAVRLGVGRKLRSALLSLNGPTRNRLRLAGQVAAPVESDDFYLSRFGVVGEMRGRGLGRRLVNEVVHEARKAGCSRCVLEVLPQREGAIRLYSSAGFQVDKEVSVTDEASGRSFNRYWMSASL